MKQLPRFLQALAGIIQILAWLLAAIAFVGLIASFVDPMKQLPRFLQALAGIIQILAWLLAAIAFVGLIASFVVPGNIEAFLASEIMAGQDFVINGFGSSMISGSVISLGMVRWTMACGILTMSLTAMIFRNLWLIRNGALDHGLRYPHHVFDRHDLPQPLAYPENPQRQ